MSLKRNIGAKRRAEMVSARSARPAGGLPVVLMYAQGEYLFAITTLILSQRGCIFSPIVKPTPGAMFTRNGRNGIIRPLPSGLHHRHCFTNYSSTNQLTFERAQEVLLIAPGKQAKPITLVFTRRAMMAIGAQRRRNRQKLSLRRF